jgi:hypothetical protein
MMLERWFVTNDKFQLNPGTAYGLGGAGHMRMNIAASRKTLALALNNIADALKKHSVRFVTFPMAFPTRRTRARWCFFVDQVALSPAIESTRRAELRGLDVDFPQGIGTTRARRGARP